jgi:aryl-alcohol dehydrogenase-like predicted oxidoreductase
MERLGVNTAGRDFKAQRRLGRTELRVTPIGLGCWQFSKGQGLVGRYWTILDDAEIQRILARAMEGGINWFDTAEGYGNGESERALARGLRDLGKSPGEVVIATKWNPFLRRASSIPATISVRLANLIPFPIDLYQIHNPLSVSSIESQIRAMARLVEDGKIRYAGVSNFSKGQMERAQRALLEVGLPLASNQVRYSLLDRRIEQNGVLAAAREHGIAIIAYSPLAQGILSGKFHDDPDLIRRRSGFRKYMTAFKPRGLEKSRPVIDALRRIAPEYGATLAQVALNWLISRHGETVVAIPGATQADQVHDFTAAMSFRLSDGDMEELDRVSAPFKNP